MQKCIVIGIILLFIFSAFTSLGLASDKPIESPWPMFGYDTKHTGRSPYSTENNHGGTRWVFIANWSSIENSIVIDKYGTLYVLDWRDLYAIKPYGKLKWCFRHGHRTYCAPAIAEDGTIYFGTSDSKLYAVNPYGTLKWKFKANNEIKSPPNIGQDGTIYFSTFHKHYSRFYAVNPDGSEKWNYSADFFSQKSPVIADDGTIIFNSHVYLYRFYPNGTLIWKKKLGDPNFTFLGGPSMDDNGTIYIPCDPGFLYAIDLNGTIKWKSPTDWGSWAAPSIGRDGTIYIGYKHMFAFNPDGSQKWVFKPDNDDWHNIDSRTYAISADGTIYIGTKYNNDCYIIALNPDGTEKWRERISWYRALSPPVIGEDGTVYMGFDNFEYSGVYAFNGEKSINRLLPKTFFMRFLERFPNAFQLLRQLLL